jgi:hypothetical protein
MWLENGLNIKTCERCKYHDLHSECKEFFSYVRSPLLGFLGGCLIYMYLPQYNTII